MYMNKHFALASIIFPEAHYVYLYFPPRVRGGAAVVLMLCCLINAAKWRLLRNDDAAAESD